MHAHRTIALALLAGFSSLPAATFAKTTAAAEISGPAAKAAASGATTQTVPAGAALRANAAPAPQAPAPARLFGAESNFWPFLVARSEPGNPLSRAGAPGASCSALGPLIFRQPSAGRPLIDAGAITARGFRPFYVGKRDAGGRLVQMHVLFPLFTWSALKDNGFRWDILMLANHERSGASPASSASSAPASAAGASSPAPGARADNRLDIWPVYFSNNTGDPATSYRAVFPFYGVVRDRIFQDRIGWFLFPLYGWSERNGTTSRAVLWPFVRWSKGNGLNAWKVWPLAGHETMTDPETGSPLFKKTFALWPFYFNNTVWNPDTPGAEPARSLAVLPFYYRETAPGLRTDSWMIFFGRTRRTAPHVYSENRYFWPLFVQGRGEGRRVNRWAPFYTHSSQKGREKTWVLWPLWNHAREDDGVIRTEKKRLAFFLYHGVSQSLLAPPGASPAQKAAIESLPPARKITVWPFCTYWTDGRGRKQLQALSPLEVFLPQSEPARITWSPLFALYRYEQEAPGHTRHSFLWNFITHRREPGLREFHVGPFYSGERVDDCKRRALFCGVLGMQKTSGKGWRPFAFRFKSLQRQLAEAAARQADKPAGKLEN